MLYETAARANEVLALNIEDLDVGARRAVVRGKGGHRQEVVWLREPPASYPDIWAVGSEGQYSSPTADPTWRQLSTDLCPDTGRGRLSYQQAWALFRNASGWTLHQLRHSALTHLGERGVGAPAAESQKPPPQPAQPRPLRTARYRSGSRAHRRA